jgi:erythromycin esterase-like protein
MMMRLPALGLVGGVLLGCGAAGQDSIPAVESAVLADVVADICDAEIVFLGEDGSHGGGRTFQVKAEIVRGLIQNCGFTHVAFESQIYDFIDLQERYVAGTATREALYDAIGRFWSRAAEIDPLVDLLHEMALTGLLTISGFDGQMGDAMSYYTPTQLAQRLSRNLSETHQEYCSPLIHRLAGSRFSQANPKDAAFDEAVLGCAREIEALAVVHADRDPVNHRLARSFLSVLKFSSTDARNDRARLMYENLAWTLARLPRGTRTVVWTATVHGLKRPLDGRYVMASEVVQSSGVSIRSIAVIGVSGEYLAPGAGPTEIVRADADSLEGHFAPQMDAELAYIDSNALRRVGSMKSRVLHYGLYEERDWVEWLDGVIVLAEEAQPTYIRPRRPMQAAMQ